jgi:hypothetical protein
MEIEQAALRLPANDTTEEDRRKITAWTGIVRDQLEQYGFGSFPVNEVQISLDTYRPEHQGFELETSFSVESRISASDLIRTIWSYLNGMLELSRTEDTHHPGCMVFDESKQQSTRDVSFKELLKRAAVSGQFGQQVIFFTSENLRRLDSYLSGLQHTRTVIDGRVIKKLGS